LYSKNKYVKKDNPYFNKKIEAYRSAIKKHIRIIIEKECPPYFRNELKYALRGGHKWRPILLLAIAEMLNKRPLRVIDTACAMEFIHCASLILDDLPSMDNAKRRRGAASFHKKFGIAQAEIVSHILVALSYRLLLNNSLALKDKKCNTIKLATDTLFNISIGQSYDLEYTGKKINLRKVKLISKYKSGIFYSKVCAASAILLDRSEKEKDALLKFGKNLGMAYTVFDDLFDIQGKPSKGGKEINKDKNKTTFPRLLGIRRAQMELENYKNKAIKCLGIFKNRGFVSYITEKILFLDKVIKIKERCQ